MNRALEIDRALVERVAHRLFDLAVEGGLDAYKWDNPNADAMRNHWHGEAVKALKAVLPEVYDVERDVAVITPLMDFYV